MRLHAPPISQHRLNRCHRWMLLWLAWLAAFLDQARAFAPLSAQATAIAHRWLDCIERGLSNIVLCRAVSQVRFLPAQKHAGRRRIKTHLRRAAIGSALRRRLRVRDLNQRIAALSQDIAVLVAHVVKRLPRGLTRRRPHHTRPEPRAITRAAALIAAESAHNTS